MLLVVVGNVGKGPGKMSRPPSPAFPVQANGHDAGDPTFDVAALEERVSTLEQAARSQSEVLAAFQTRLFALEEDVRSRTERREEQASAVLTSEEFERRYESSVRAILERMEAEEAKAADAKTVRKYLDFYIRDMQEPHLEAAQAEELFILLLEVRADMVEVEKRFAPHGVVPQREWPDYQLMTAAWQALLDRWSPAIARFTGRRYVPRVIHDLTPKSLRLGELDSMAYR